jgi:hypothetical protein
LGRRNDLAVIWMMGRGEGFVICHGLGGGPWPDRSDRNSAWNFFLYAKDPTRHPEGEWRGRLIFKRFASRDDVLQEYQTYKRLLGQDWRPSAYGPIEK